MRVGTSRTAGLAVGLVLVAGCAGQGTAGDGAGVPGGGGTTAAAAPPGAPGRLSELGIAFPVPEQVRDVVYVVGEGAEDKPAVFLSSTSLAAAGGATCAAGATAAVSPFPLGRVIVADESPEQVGREAQQEPDDELGEPLAQVGGRWLYYTPPPDEPCSARPGAAQLQAGQAAAVEQALRSATPLPAP